ncbi:MAG TPA: hypothetical protein VD828_00645 [Candidatus Nitrosotenuis sp.]|nr:hypothetical protein [Candidatus Nitrosotenuis sp.]
MASKLILCAALLGFFVILTSSSQSFAVEEDEIKATDKIKNNPALMDILKKIELSKKILADMQEKKKIQDQKALHIQEARKVAQQDLAAELDRMNKDNEPFTPANAFARFVSKKPTNVHDIYWSMFNYQQEKIKAAKESRDRILASGGTWNEAWDSYQKISATNRIKIIELNKDFNIKHGNADANIQNTFDINGKLPRYD